jgi:hypothetical protein
MKIEKSDKVGFIFPGVAFSIVHQVASR